MAKSVYTIVTRTLVFIATVSALVVTLLSNKAVDLDTSKYIPKYTDWGALRYFVIANCIASCYTFLVLFIPSGSLLWRLVAAVDMVVSILIATGGTAGADVAYQMKYGNPQAGWQPYCPCVPAYCNYIFGAVAVCCVGALLQMLLTLYTFHIAMNPLLDGSKL
ncbi:CASP-like protein 1C1 [Actinidia eriantha]|uniref:CASP-like protein 1C1 n=1 Tax=Actinidia eriantha TaxID=165200 RepID=UPI00258DF6C2|nr:CASP-like protein 1C1 [Actinidia eriantha]